MRMSEYQIRLPGVYRIENIESKCEEKVNRWHTVCLGKLCIVDCLVKMQCAHMKIEGLIDPGVWSGFHTSSVYDVRWEGEIAIIETRNSVYTLRRLPDDSV